MLNAKKNENHRSVRRHMKNSHDDNFQNSKTSTLQNDIDGNDTIKTKRFLTLSECNTPITSTVTTVSNENLTGNFDIIKFEQSIVNSEIDASNAALFSKHSFLIKSLQESAIKFSLEMHNRSDFNRKDVVFIQNMIVSHIVTQIILTVRHLNESI